MTFASDPWAFKIVLRYFGWIGPILSQCHLMMSSAINAKLYTQFDFP